MAPLTWPALEGLATGCEEDFLEASVSHLRLPTEASLLDEQPSSKALASQLNEGVSVLFWDGSSLEQRVLKVDNKMAYLYIVGGAVSGKDRGVIPLAWPMRQITDVHWGVQAVKYCRDFNVMDHCLTLETAIVMEIGERAEGEEPAYDDLVFLCVAPQLRLKDSLGACLGKKPKAGGEASSSGQQQGGKATVAPRLDGARVKDKDGIIRFVRQIEVETLFFTPAGQQGGSLRAWPVKVPMAVSACPAAVERIESKVGKMAPVDYARVLFVLEEAALTHAWAMDFNNLFKFDFARFLEKKAIPGSAGSESAAATPRSVDTINNVCRMPQTGNYYCRAGLTSVLLALRQLLDLENQRRKLRANTSSRSTPRQETPQPLRPEQPPPSIGQAKAKAAPDAPAAAKPAAKPQQRSRSSQRRAQQEHTKFMAESDQLLEKLNAEYTAANAKAAEAKAKSQWPACVGGRGG